MFSHTTRPAELPGSIAAASQGTSSSLSSIARSDSCPQLPHLPRIQVGKLKCLNRPVVLLVVNGWRYPTPKWDLSATTSCGGPPTGRWQASLPTTPEAVYLINFQDADWSRFEPDRSYPLRVNADGLRP